MSPTRAVIFDFDGVILESAEIKTRTFARLFEDEGHSEHVPEIVALHLRLAGVSRFEKFRLIYSEILDRPLDDAELERLGEEFSRIALDEVLACPFVPGAHELLERLHGDGKLLFVASGTPHEELVGIVAARELDRFFRGVNGSPATKGEISRRILVEHRLAPTEALFVGDATTDLEGAREAGVPFVGRRPADVENPFADEGVPTVADMAELDTGLEELVDAALAATGAQRA